MDLDGITYVITSNDSYLIGPLAHAEKKVDQHITTPTRLDGDKIMYHPELLDKMENDGPPQILGEIVHMSLMHPDRRKAVVAGIRGLEPVFDIAADLATFHNITTSKKFVSPADFGFKEGLAVEDYFDLLMQKLNSQGIDPNSLMDEQQGQGQGQGGQGQGQGQNQGKDQQDEEQKKEDGGAQNANAYDKLLQKMGIQGKQKQDHSQWNSVPMVAQQNAQAMMMSALKSRGDLPMGMQRLLKMMAGEPQVRWMEKLRIMIGCMVAATKKRYTMSKPSRRFGIPHPGTKRLKRPMIACHLDTSGSMDDVDTAIAVKEVKGIADAYGAPFMFLTGDTEVQVVERILSKYDMDKVRIKGGGGTDHRPVFKFLEDRKEPVEVLICFTDMYSVFPETPPRYQVIWVTSTKDVEPPFGEMFKIEKKEQ